MDPVTKPPTRRAASAGASDTFCDSDDSASNSFAAGGVRSAAESASGDGEQAGVPDPVAEASQKSVSESPSSGQLGESNSLADLGQPGALDVAWAQLRYPAGPLREIALQLRDVAAQLQRKSGRRAWLADVRALPSALRWALPWAVLGRTSRDANPCRWLERQARVRPDVVAASDRGRALTFAQLHTESLGVADALRRHEVAADTRVAILLPTGVELVATLLGCWRLGAIPCPLDPDTPTTLLNEIRAPLGAELEITNYAELIDTASADSARVVAAHPPAAERPPTTLTDSERDAAAHPMGSSDSTTVAGRAKLSQRHIPMHAAQMAMILPTSGSEGHVKLCRITAGRLALSGHAFGGVALDCRRGDVIYCPLPLCHATGITVGLMPALVHGVTLHLPGKFSASRFVQDLRDANATQLVYVGDLLRMAVAAITSGERGRGSVAPTAAVTTTNDGLGGGSEAPRRVAVPATRNDGTDSGAGAPSAHRVRVAVGNGLDQTTYRHATKLLKIPRIVEFYGATEAPRVLFNLSQRAGSCGRVALRRMSRFVVVKQHEVASLETDQRATEHDSDQHATVVVPDTEQRAPVASAGGATACQWKLCKPGEVGELWIRIPSRRRPWLGDFEGYLERADESRALVSDVFRPGDRFYRTHDLVRYDKDDYFYFVDRVGTVWRNLGHNVSTRWLANELRQVDGVSDACVFPVALDDSARRFGLALLVMANEERSRDALTQKINSLPRYAQPQLIQLLPLIPRTHSYKPKRSNGAGTVFQPAASATALLIWDRGVLREIARDEWQTQCKRLLES